MEGLGWGRSVESMCGRYPRLVHRARAGHSNPWPSRSPVSHLAIGTDPDRAGATHMPRSCLPGSGAYGRTFSRPPAKYVCRARAWRNLLGEPHGNQIRSWRRTEERGTTRWDGVPLVGDTPSPCRVDASFPYPRHQLALWCRAERSSRALGLSHAVCIVKRSSPSGSATDHEWAGVVHRPTDATLEASAWRVETRIRMRSFD